MATTQEALIKTEAHTASGSQIEWLPIIASFPVMCMVLMAGRLLSFSVEQFTESDLWWHLRDAQILVQQHSLSSVDAYSFTATGLPWINFSWLSELIYYLAYKALGLQGILLTFFAVVALIYVGVYYLSCRNGANCKDAAITTFAAICLGGVSIGPRMLLFGWLCMIGVLLVLDYFRRTGSGLWLLPPIFALWINCHGSWPFGLVVLGIFLVSGLVEGRWGAVVATRWNGSQLKQLLIASAASLAALLVNPFGYKLLLVPVRFSSMTRVLTRFVEEWHPASLSNLDGIFAFGVILALFATFLLSSGTWRLDEVLLIAFALWSALSHVRFVFFLGMVAMPILAPRLSLFPPYERERDKKYLNAAIIIVVIAAMVYFFPSEINLQQKFDDEYPKAALAFMQGQNISGRIFNQYKFGGYMEFHAPQFKTFIDGRAELFTMNDTFADYLQATGISKPFETLDKYNIQCVFLEPDEPLVYVLQHSSGWRQVYSDRIAVVFERVQPPRRPWE